MGFFDFIILIVLLSMIKGTVHKCLDYRMRMADRLVGGRNLLQVVEELRAEMAALKQREADAILSFDSTLHTLDARLTHLERRVLPDGTADRGSISAAGRMGDEPVRVDLKGGFS